MTCVIKDHNKFYLQLFLEHALYAKVCKRYKERINACSIASNDEMVGLIYAKTWEYWLNVV